MLLWFTGACVEGGATLAGDRCTLTPLQVSSASVSSVEIVALLLAHGANGFLSTQHTDSMCFAQRGCYSAISVAAAHDQRATLRKLLSHPLAPVSREVLSLEEMLAEGDSSARNGVDRSNEVPSTLSKTQIKCLQEAMYHSAENNHLGKSHLRGQKSTRRVITNTFSTSTYTQILPLSCVHSAYHGHSIAGCTRCRPRTSCDWIRSSINCCKTFCKSVQTIIVHSSSPNAFHCCSIYFAIVR